MDAATKRGRPSAQDAAALTDKIIDEALALFLEQGYAATSLEGIASRAGVAKHTVYRRFEDKGALFAAVMSRGGHSVLTRAAAQSDQSAMRRLRAFAATALDHILTPRSVAFMRMVIAESHRFPELAERFGAESDGDLPAAMERLVIEAQSEGDLRAGDPAWLARMLMSLITRHPLHASLTGSDEFADEKAREAHVDAVLSLFSTGPGLGGR